MHIGRRAGKARQAPCPHEVGGHASLCPPDAYLSSLVNQMETMSPAKLAGSNATRRSQHGLGHDRCKVSSSSFERWALRASGPWRRSPPR